MKIELINTGTELLLGSVLNLHQLWLGAEFFKMGYTIDRQITVADTAEAIREVVSEALSRADLVMTTGGLGPTADDLTRSLIAELLQRELTEDPVVLAHIREFFARRNRPMPASTAVQALVPAGAVVLMNAHGTAPGLALEVPPGAFRPSATPGLLIMLPGPPSELQPMFLNQVAPLLREKFPLSVRFVCQVLRTTGLGESLIEQMIRPSLRALLDAGLELGYCARFGEVDVRISARGLEAEALVAEAQAIVQKSIGQYIFGSDQERLETVVVRLLTETGQSLALAESCTGGFISHRITNVPGASVVFPGGLTTYSNASKERFLGVNPATLATDGAVSERTAREMAEGARSRCGASFGLGVTGIAGPSGGSAEKPVGTVYIALAGPKGTTAVNHLNAYDRETFKFVTSQQALDLLRRTLLA